MGHPEFGANPAAHFPITVMNGLVGAPASEVFRLLSSLEAICPSHIVDRSLFPMLRGA